LFRVDSRIYENYPAVITGLNCSRSTAMHESLSAIDKNPSLSYSMLVLIFVISVCTLQLTFALFDSTFNIVLNK